MSVPPTRADDDDTVDDAYTEPPITASDRDHWSLKPRTLRLSPISHRWLMNRWWIGCSNPQPQNRGSRRSTAIAD